MIYRYNPSLRHNNVISCVTNFCEAINIEEQEFRAVAALPDSKKYNALKDPLFKSDGTPRDVKNPAGRLRVIQRRINRRIFKPLLLWPSFIYGSIPKEEADENNEIRHTDYINCARIHCSSKTILKIDIKDFFGNVHYDHVFHLLRKFFHYDEELSALLCRIFCFQSNLVQGALTSSYLASLILWDIEGDLVKRLHRKNLNYTRLVDDITVSSKKTRFDFSSVIGLITETLNSKDLPINNAKTAIMHAGVTPLTVHGLRVNFSEPRLQSDEVRVIRASVNNCTKLAKDPSFRTTNVYRKDFNRCLGKLSKLKRVEHNQYEKLKNKLLLCNPLPAKSDIDKAKKTLERLKKDFPDKYKHYSYRKRFFNLQNRLNVLKERFPSIAKEIRTELRGLKPCKDYF